jgi:3-phosphoshikimate 1-carboxyvinyltransferase
MGVHRVRASPRLEGEISVPGDKSISHRAAILNGIAEGPARIRGFLFGEDCLSTLACLKALGVRIEREGEELLVEGRGLQGLEEPAQVLDAGNSGTTLRLLAGLLAGQPFFSVLSGDDSLRSRPMARVVEPLRLMGARILGRQDDSRAPLAIRGGRLKAIHYTLPVASAQLKSALLLAGLYAKGKTTLVEPSPSRDHTERMLRAMGAHLITYGDEEQGGQRIVLEPPGSLRPLDLEVPGDLSSAAFWLVAAAIHPQARVRVRGVGLNPTRTGVLDVLRSMGGRLYVEEKRRQGEEPLGDITVESSPLVGTEIGGGLIPRVIDEIPVLAVAAAVASGTTVIKDAAELRVKESDRIAALGRELVRLGARVEERPDGMIIKGGARLRGASCRSHGDHRLAMALAVAGTVAQGETIIEDGQAVSISYPGFWQDLSRLSEG